MGGASQPTRPHAHARRRLSAASPAVRPRRWAALRGRPPRVDASSTPPTHRSTGHLLPQRLSPRLLVLVATLALALAPSALASAHGAVCAAHGAARSAHATRACAHLRRTARSHRARHTSGGTHARHARKHARVHTPAVTRTQPARCEDASTPLSSVGEATCADGSEALCQDGSTPFLDAHGALVCAVQGAGEQAEAACEGEVCSFDSEGDASPEEALCEACRAPSAEADE